MKKVNIILFFSIFLLINQGFSQIFNDNIYKLSKVLDLVNRYYVDTVNQTDLVEDVIVKTLKSLDPHSVYISKDEVKEMNEPLQGSFDGIGIQFNILNDTIIVISPISGGPSEKLGIMANDRIIIIEDENVAGIGMSTKGVRDRLLGKKGTKVKIGIKRKGEKELLDFVITRDKIPIFSLDAAYMIEDNIGYIKLNRFSATTIKEFRDALTKLQEHNIENLILDLSNNGGGYLNTAIDLADEFLENRKLIVYTEGISSSKYEYLATSNGNFEKGKIIIIIDEGSASASEIVSGAVQDWDRGIIIGRRSFGKGLVQRPFYLPDGSMIRLTVARYYTPTGRLIQKSYDKGAKEYHKDLINRYNNGELSNKDSIHFPDSLKYQTLNNKRYVYGGGGIMPDIFIPIDTTSYSDYYRDLIRKGLLNQFILQFMDNNRKYLKNKYANFSDFNSKYDVDDKMMIDLIEYAEQKELEKNEKEFNISKEHIRIHIKALIARNLWGISEYFQIINTLDTAFKKAIEVIKDDKLYKNKLTKQFAEID
ncbi:MAG: S41 family peptidase [Bacteroidales bacterium]|nr:S41 family peptidase [Bacteroidales bacterium]